MRHEINGNPIFTKFKNDRAVLLTYLFSVIFPNKITNEVNRQGVICYNIDVNVPSLIPLASGVMCLNRTDVMA